MAERAYAINPEGIAHEVLEGEALLINFKTGSYYSLEGIGGLVWEQLCAAPTTASALSRALAAGLATDADALHSSIAQFLHELEQEGLVTPATQPTPAATATNPFAPRLFQPPVLKKYSDLEALLRLDPIHDVVVGGWPNAKPDAP